MSLMITRVDVPQTTEPEPEPRTIYCGDPTPAPVVAPSPAPPLPPVVAAAVSQHDPATLFSGASIPEQTLYLINPTTLPAGLACRVGPGRINRHAATVEAVLTLADLKPITEASEAAVAKVSGLVRQVEELVSETDEARAHADAVQAAEAGQRELAEAVAKLADLRAKHDAAVESGKNPATFAGKIVVVEAELQATRDWVAGLSRKVQWASADVGRVRARITRDLADAELQELAGKRAELQARAEAFLRGFAVEVLQVEAASRAVEVLKAR